jgi:hypothetical protein
MSSLKLRELVSLGAVVGLSAALIGTSYAATDSSSEVSQLSQPSRIVGATLRGIDTASVQEFFNELVATEQLREDLRIGGFELFE